MEHGAKYTSISESCSGMKQSGTESFNEVKCEGVEGFRLVLDNKKLVSPMETLISVFRISLILLQ